MTKERVKYEFARRLAGMGASAIREILKVTERPDVISFAGGLPAPEVFPVEELARAHAEVFAEEGAQACQYSTTEGFGPLREWIAGRMRARGVARADAARVLVTSGSQQGIDLVGKIFLEPGDPVVVENPCYLAALQVFRGYEAELVAVGSDDEGMRVEEVERAVAGAPRRPKLIYVVSQFHNPKGTTLSPARRRALLDVARRFGVPIVEDDPYGELRYRGAPVSPLAASDDDGLVIYLSTFSKTLSPGMRVGWAHASEEVFGALVRAKQAADLHTNTIQQRAAARLLASFDFDAHVERIKTVYGERLDAMLAALAEHFPVGARWTRPEGGLFLWVELPEGLSAEELFDRAIAERVAFVPGAPFFAADARRNFMRLNFSNSKPEAIEEGVRRLGGLLRSAA
ncbi:MAG TPA: PLP-dependent aminotransferase family protein [Pyrinomonadaceae bacterium]|jgi:2-aminoadipate transaminase|nr:PLP-dependent aminotransferase family protein [Pyrinomonadaceae bacterium]